MQIHISSHHEKSNCIFLSSFCFYFLHYQYFPFIILTMFFLRERCTSLIFVTKLKYKLHGLFPNLFVYIVDCKWILIKSINIVYTKNYLFCYLLTKLLTFFFYNSNKYVTVFKRFLKRLLFSRKETINYLFNNFREGCLHEIHNWLIYLLNNVKDVVKHI